MSNLKFPSLFTPLNNKPVSDANILNAYLSGVRGDLQSTFSFVESAENDINAFSTFFLNDQLDNVLLKLAEIKNRCRQYEVSASSDYLTVMGVDFLSGTSPALLKDPKTNLSFMVTDKCVGASNSLSLPVISSIVHDGVYLADTSGGRQRTIAGITHIIKLCPDNNPIEFSVDYNLASAMTANGLSLDSASMFSIDITNVSVVLSDRSVVSFAGQYLGVTGKIDIHFPETALIKMIRLKVRINSSKATNLYVTADKILENLISAGLPYLDTFDDNPAKQSLYSSFIFHFALKSMSVFYKTFKDTGVFVSQPLTAQKLSHFDLDLKASGDSSLFKEFYVLKDAVMIPVIPFKTNNAFVYEEVMVIDTLSGRLTFIPNEATLEVYKNGVLLSASLYTISGKIITLLTYNTIDFYHVAYTPLFCSSSHMIGSEATLATIEEVVVASDGLENLDTIIFYLENFFKQDSVTVSRKVNGVVETTSPPVTFTLTGRTLTIMDYDLTLYPRLANAVWTISGEIVDNLVTSNSAYLYSNDGSVLVTNVKETSRLQTITILRKNKTQVAYSGNQQMELFAHLDATVIATPPPRRPYDVY